MNNVKLSRRRALTAAGVGAATLAAMARPGQAAEMTAAEKANVKIVNDFCAAWPKHDLELLMGFFAENGAYRVTEAQEPNKGKAAVRERIKTFVERVKSFEVLDTWA